MQKTHAERRAPVDGSWRAVRHRGGNAALEVALIAPILVLVAVGIADYGLSIQRKMQVQHAAQAGADYAMRSGFDIAAITNAVASATLAPGISASPPPVESCGCATSTTITATPCSTVCPDGRPAGTYVTVSAQGNYSTLLPYPGIPEGFAFTATAITRTR